MKTRRLCLLLVLMLPGIVLPTSAQSLRDVFRQVKPGVVVIRTLEREIAPAQGGFVSMRGLGSGVLISNEGHVMTAAHVVQTADQVGVEFPDGHFSLAQVVASVPPADVALLKLEEMPPGVAPLPLGDSDQLEVGDEVFVVGAPYGLSHTLTVGHLSARHAPNRIAGNLTAVELFQTDAAINTGNSGGPMFNVQGEVVGIVSHILSQSGGFEGLGFAVTSKAARELLLEQPSFWSGLEGHLLTGELAALLNVPQAAGVLVQRVAAQSPAADLELEPGVVPAQIGDETLLLGGDIILEVLGIPITGEGSDFQRIQTTLAQHPAGAPMTVKVLRDGQVLELHIP